MNTGITPDLTAETSAQLRNPGVMQRIYDDELTKLDQYARSQKNAAPGSA